MVAASSSDAAPTRARDPGRRGEGSPGHGIGLTLCQRIAESCGGSIELARSDPSGTCFRLRLRQASVTEPAADPAGTS